MGSPTNTGPIRALYPGFPAKIFGILSLYLGLLTLLAFLSSGSTHPAGVIHGPVLAQDCEKLDRCKGSKNCEFQLVLALSRDPELLAACKLTYNCTRNTSHPLCPQEIFNCSSTPHHPLCPQENFNCSLSPNDPLCPSQPLIKEQLCKTAKDPQRSSKIIFTDVEESIHPENCREFSGCRGNCSCVLMLILALSEDPGRLEECKRLVNCSATPENPLCPFLQAKDGHLMARESLVVAHHGPVNATTCQDVNINRRCLDKHNQNQCLLQVLLFLSNYPEMLEECKRLADCREFSTNPLCPLLEQEALDSDQNDEDVQCIERLKRSTADLKDGIDGDVIILESGVAGRNSSPQQEHPVITTCEKLIRCQDDSDCLLDLVLAGSVDISQVEDCSSILNCSTSSQDNPLFAILCPDLETSCEDIIGQCDEVVTCNKACSPGTKGVCCCNICPLCDKNDPDQKRCTDNPQAAVANFDIDYTDELFTSLCEESDTCSYCCQPGKQGVCLCNNCEMCSEVATAPFICTEDPAAARVDMETPCSEMEKNGKCDNVTVCGYSCNEEKQGVCCCDACPSCDESRRAMCRADPCLGSSPPPECLDPCLGKSPPPECLTTMVDPPIVFSGCPAAMKCISPTRCKIHRNGLTTISDSDVSTDINAISKYKTINRCKLASAPGGVGLCCLDPNYMDPWPCGMDKNLKCVDAELCDAKGIIAEVPDPSVDKSSLTTLKKCSNEAMGVKNGVCCRKPANIDSGLFQFPEDVEDLFIPQFLTVVSQLQKLNTINYNEQRKGKSTHLLDNAENKVQVKNQLKLKLRKGLQRKLKKKLKEGESFENPFVNTDVSITKDCNDINCRKFVPPRTSVKVCPKSSQCRTECAGGETSISPKMLCIVSGQRKLGQCCEER